MEDIVNPEVQKGPIKLNEISSKGESQTWKGLWISEDPIQEYEYINDRIRVVRNQIDGALVSVVSRFGEDFDKLENLVQQGRGAWIR